MSSKAEFEFGTKAETLAALQPRVTRAVVPEFIHFSLRDWSNKEAELLESLKVRFGDHPLIVRSSAISEDGERSSMAGRYDSIGPVRASDPGQLRSAIADVAASMPGGPRDRVMVQMMPRNVRLSGVIMTFDISRGAPYYCIEFDDETGRTDVVTSGAGAHKSLYVYRNADQGYVKSERVNAFLALAKELEDICQCPAIDIEFGQDSEGQLFLFQVRRIVLARNWHPVIERRVERQLSHVEAFLEGRSQRCDGVAGARTILAVMPDWNPAEIIGTTPRPLAVSLYRHLITDAVWRESRTSMGYRRLADADLMVVIAHHPYIDVRNSFNSFLPADVSEGVAETLVNAWMDRLDAFPELHDKVEFEIVPTCIDFTFENDFSERYPGLLGAEEFASYRESLAALTRRCLQPSPENSLAVAVGTAEKLISFAYAPVPAADPYANLARASTLISHCREFGTFPFSIAARQAFISEALLRSAVRRGALEPSRLDQFKRTIRTISGIMLEEYASVCDGRLDRSSFLAKYGHLRPGTYEITSLRYDERDDLFQETMEHSPVRGGVFELTGAERRAIEALLQEARLTVLSADELIRHAGAAIAARENVKFRFTKTLSDAMAHVLIWGTHHGLSRDDLSYLEWREIARGLSEPVLDDLDRRFLDVAHARRQDMVISQTLKFAHIISRPRDIYVATLNRSTPNFIGVDATSGPVIRLTPNSPTSVNLAGCIVCIENADPGFDWIFTRGLAALVTRFGGANSHMAVRCAELGVPAAIGCGDQIFDQVSVAARAELNCAEKILRPLSG